MYKPYIEINTQKRMKADKNKCEVGKTFYKLMSKAIWEKTMENLRKKIDV